MDDASIPGVDRALRMHARVSRENGGGKPALILVPGLVVSSRNVAPTAALLQERFSVYALDLPGYGKSGKPARRALGVPELAEALRAWMDASGLPDAHLLGNSFGCQVIVELAHRHPRRVGRLVLTGPALDPDIRDLWRPALRLGLDACFEPGLIPVALYDFLEMGPRRVWATYRAALADRIEEKLPRVDARTLLVRGGRDPIASQAWLERMAAALPDAEHAGLPGAAHAVAYNAPRQLAPLVSEFLLRA